jgi:hypothetical protein
VLAATPVTQVTATAAMAVPGTNLLLNPEPTAGAAPGFPKTAKSWPGSRGNLFALGAGGTAKLVQATSVTPNARYDIAGWLGGTATGAAELTVQFTAQAGEFSPPPRQRVRRPAHRPRRGKPAL